MNSRQLAQVGLGLIGVWALLIALQGFMTLAVVAGASLGVLLLVQAIPGAISALLGFFAAGELPTMPSRAGPVRFFIGSAVQPAIALFLIMRPQRLLDYVRRPVATTDQ